MTGLPPPIVFGANVKSAKLTVPLGFKVSETPFDTPAYVAVIVTARGEDTAYVLRLKRAEPWPPCTVVDA